MDIRVRKSSIAAAEAVCSCFSAQSPQLLAAFSDVTAAAAVALNPGFPHTTDSTPATLAQKCNCKMFFGFQDFFGKLFALISDNVNYFLHTFATCIFRCTHS